MKTSRKILSIVLALVMLLTVGVTGAFAEGETDPTNEPETVIVIDGTAINVEAPRAGLSPCWDYFVEGIDGYTVTDLVWYDVENAKDISIEDAEFTFAPNSKYTLKVELTADEGYSFSNEATATVNENAADNIIVSDDGSTMLVTYTFVCEKEGTSTSVITNIVATLKQVIRIVVDFILHIIGLR